MPDPTHATEHYVLGKYAMAAEIVRLQEALRTIAMLDPSFKGVFRKYQKAIQTARSALGLEVK